MGSARQLIETIEGTPLRRYRVTVTTDVTRPSRKWEVEASSFRDAWKKAGQDAYGLKVRYSEGNAIPLPPRNAARAKSATFSGPYIHGRVELIQPTVTEALIKGEYWIFPDGDVHYCDGDVGDVNHEGYAMMHAMGVVRSAMGLNDADDMDDTVQLLADIKTAWYEDATPEEVAEMEEHGDDYDIADLMAKKHKVDHRLLSIAVDRRGGDARLYAAQHWGWHALRGDNVETWNISERSLKSIARGIMSALDDSASDSGGDIDPEHEFTIWSYNGNRAINLTYRQLETNDFGEEFNAPKMPPGAGSEQVRKMDQDQSPDFYKGNLGDSARCQHRLGKHTTHTCTRSAVVQRNGKGYCSRHDPEKSHSALPLDGRRRFRWVAEEIIETEQLGFRVPGGDHSDDIEQEASYQSAVALSGYCHQPGSTAWIYDGVSLKTKLNPKEVEEGSDGNDFNSHYSLFGYETVQRARFRGWFVPDKRLVTVMDRDGKVSSPDELPEALYRKLTQAFNPRRPGHLNFRVT